MGCTDFQSEGRGSVTAASGLGNRSKAKPERQAVLAIVKIHRVRLHLAGEVERVPVVAAAETVLLYFQGQRFGISGVEKGIPGTIRVTRQAAVPGFIVDVD